MWSIIFHGFSWRIWSSRTVPSHLEPFAELQSDYLISQYPQISSTVLVFVEFADLKWPRELYISRSHWSLESIECLLSYPTLRISVLWIVSMRCAFSLCRGLRWFATVSGTKKYQVRAGRYMHDVHEYSQDRISLCNRGTIWWTLLEQEAVIRSSSIRRCNGHCWRGLIAWKWLERSLLCRWSKPLWMR